MYLLVFPSLCIYHALWCIGYTQGSLLAELARQEPIQIKTDVSVFLVSLPSNYTFQGCSKDRSKKGLQLSPKNRLFFARWFTVNFRLYVLDLYKIALSGDILVLHFQSLNHQNFRKPFWPFFRFFPWAAGTVQHSSFWDKKSVKISARHWITWNWKLTEEE